MMNKTEREQALTKMELAVDTFYRNAVSIGNHPFIEFAGVMTAYTKSCRRAHEAGIDFTDCNAHSGKELPMESFEVDYLAEKLECIFGSRIQAAPPANSDLDVDAFVASAGTVSESPGQDTGGASRGYSPNRFPPLA